MIKDFIENLYNQYQSSKIVSVTVVDILIELDNKNIKKLNPEVKSFLRNFSYTSIKSQETNLTPLIKKFLKSSEGKSLDDFIDFLFSNKSILNVLSVYFGVSDVKQFLFRVDSKADKDIDKKDKDKDKDKSIEFLENHGRDLITAAKKRKLNKVFGRDQEIQRIVQVLLRKTKNSPVLIGEAGVGKTAIVEGLAQKIANKEIKELSDVSIYELSVSSLLAGTSLRGELEKKLENLIKSLEDRPDVILFIDEIHTIMLDNTISNVLKPASKFLPQFADCLLYLV